MDKYTIEMSSKTIRLFLYIYPFITSLFLYVFPLNFLVSIFLYFAVPAGILSFIRKRYIRHIAVFSTVVSLPLVIIIDHIMHVTNGWYVSSIFSYRVFDYVPIEDFVWGFLYVYFILIYYKTFHDKRLKETYIVKHRFEDFVEMLAVIFVAFTALFFLNKTLLFIEYFYVKLGIVLVIAPLTYALNKYKHLFSKFIHVGIYFAVVSFLYELVAIKNGYWSFPDGSQHIGMVQFGSIQFPFEELFFWILLGSMGILSFYELFDDDRK